MQKPHYTHTQLPYSELEHWSIKVDIVYSDWQPLFPGLGQRFFTLLLPASSN